MELQQTIPPSAPLPSMLCPFNNRTSSSYRIHWVGRMRSAGPIPLAMLHRAVIACFFLPFVALGFFTH